MTPGRGGLTPGSSAAPGSAMGGKTPGSVRDNLSINAEEEQLHGRDGLRHGLAGLPKPRNDYEIVIPEGEAAAATGEEEDEAVAGGYVEDAADTESRRASKQEAERASEMKKRSQAVQRDLPRPQDVNHAVAETRLTLTRPSPTYRRQRRD
ncbi:PREDICTED: cell division cycle 5-like protein [Priapulus caudatus]|uniref:Cell division cycle 5-like protein n=1 Tax=Priapulus caudatus TaxID=37621 RepID=A0ABM1F6Z5_PRICU|nr:PREDICTED: cell division cycle 5-like protein [Priapulus caudatus]